jgi:WD40 repeat protein
VKGNYKALLIGVNEYKESSYADLPSVQGDIDCLHYFFSNYASFKNIQKLVGASNTKNEQLSAAVENFFLNCDDDDVLILYWAGHGCPTHEDGYFIASNTDTDLKNTAISMNKVRDLIDRCSAEAIISIFDCCFSGIVTRSDMDFAYTLNNSFQINGTGRVIMTASAPWQEANNTIEDINGVFTHCLLEELGEILESNKKEVDFTSLYSETVCRVEEYIKRWEQITNKKFKPQTPCLNARLEGRLTIKLIGDKAGLERHRTNSNNGHNNKTIKTRSGIILYDSEQLKKDFLFKNSLDNISYLEKIKKYVDVALVGGKANLIKPNKENNNNVFKIRITWDDWLRYNDKLSVREKNFFIAVSPDYAREIYENEEGNDVLIRIKIMDNNPYIDSTYLLINGEEIPILGIKSQSSCAILKQHNNEIIFMTFFPGNEELLSISKCGEMVKWDYKRGERIWEFAIPLEHNTFVETARISPDFKHLILICHHNKKSFLYIFRIDNNQLMEIEKHANIIDAAFFNKDYSHIALLTDQDTIIVKKINTNENKKILKQKNKGFFSKLINGEEEYYAIDILKNDKEIIVLSDKTDLKFWNLETEEANYIFEKKSITLFGISPDDSFLFIGHKKGCKIIDFNTEDLYFKTDKHPTAFTFSPCNSSIAISLEESGVNKKYYLYLCDYSKIKCQEDRIDSYLYQSRFEEIDGLDKILTDHKEIITSLAYSYDGEWMASGDKVGEIRIWKLN